MDLTVCQKIKTNTQKGQTSGKQTVPALDIEGTRGASKRTKTTNTHRNRGNEGCIGQTSMWRTHLQPPHVMRQINKGLHMCAKRRSPSPSPSWNRRM